MYGMVNRALQDMVTAVHGAGAWTRIRARAGVDEPLFLSDEAYPDAMTYDLVAAAARELDTPPEVLLGAFGRWWVRHTAPAAYGPLLALGGSSLPEFLQNLDDLHARVALAMPDLAPPSFRVQAVAGGALELVYCSRREGLAPFVVGLVEALGERFGTPTRVRLVRPRRDGGLEDVFEVRWGEVTA